MKKFVAMILATVMILSLCACQTNPLTGGKNINGLSPDEAVKQAMEQLNTVNSYQLDAEIGFTISAMGQSVEMRVLMNGEQTQNPDTAHITMTLDTGFASEKMESYVVKDGENYTVYSNSDGGTWTKEVTSDNQSVFDYNSFDNNLGNGTDYKSAGAETVNGENCNHYVGTISADQLIALFGAMNSLDGLGLDPTDPETAAQFDDLQMDFWVSMSTGRLVRLSVDLTPLIRGMFSSLAQNADVEVEFSNAVMQFDFSRYNEIAPIEVPADVIAQAN